MGTIVDKLNKILGTKSAIRQAIVDMGQSVIGTASFSSYAAKIRAISSDATTVAGDILSGKTAYAGGRKITGTIPGRGAADLTVSGAAVGVPAGHYPEAVSKSVATADQAAPGISVGSSGLITASVTQGAGYVAAGTKSATRQLATQAGTTITPGTSAKTAVAAGRYTTGAVTVAGSSNLVAANIKSGVSIFGVAGSLPNIAPATLVVTTTSKAGGLRMIGLGPNGAAPHSWGLLQNYTQTFNPLLNSYLDFTSLTFDPNYYKFSGLTFVSSISYVVNGNTYWNATYLIESEYVSITFPR